MNKRDMRKSLRESLDSALQRIESSVSGITAETTEYLKRIAPFEVSAGIGLDEVKTSFATAKGAGISFAKTAGIGTDDWRVIARDKVPGKDVKTLYRWQNAGAVARVLGDESLAGASVGNLVPLYRILSALTKSASDEDRAAAEDLVRAAWAEALADAGTENGVQVPPDSEDVKTIAERLSPTTRSGGSETTVSEDDGEDDDDDGDEDGDEESRRESASGLVVVDPAAVESAMQAWVPALRQAVETHGVTADVVSAIGLLVLRFAGEHGPGTMAAVLAGKGETE